MESMDLAAKALLRAALFETNNRALGSLSPSSQEHKNGTNIACLAIEKIRKIV